jgi:hypothetical protein
LLGCGFQFFEKSKVLSGCGEWLTSFVVTDAGTLIFRPRRSDAPGQVRAVNLANFVRFCQVGSKAARRRRWCRPVGRPAAGFAGRGAICFNCAP